MSENLGADARIIKTVRSLQKTQPKEHRESTADMYKLRLNSSSEENSDMPNSGLAKSNTPNKNSVNFLKNKSQIISSISIDGAKNRNGEISSRIKEDEEDKISSINNKKSTINMKNGPKTVKKNTFTSSSTNFNKTVNDKNRKLVDSYMIKYKGFCILYVKDDHQLKKLSDMCRINNIENFLEESLFNSAVFQYKCEQMFLANDANKVKKEKLIKDECKKLLENILLDLQVESQIKKINDKIENHLENIKKVEFIQNV